MSLQVLTLWSGEMMNEAEERLLRTSCAEVAFPLDAAAQRDVAALIEAFLARDDALGLAAPQIGISRRIVIYRNKDFGDDKSTWTKSAKDYDLLINPRITQARGELIYNEEGCLSCPEIQVEVGRFPEIKIRALNSKGQKINKRYQDFIARVAQHELDHLDGKLIVDHEGALTYPKKRSAFFKKVFRFA